MAKTRTITIGVHNLSGSLTEVRRTGIQEVVFQILKEVINFQNESLELVPILRLPLCNRSHTPFFIPTHFNASFAVLDATLNELGIDRSYCVKRWPYLAELFREDYSETRYDTACIETIAASDLYFEVSLSDIRNVMDSVRELNAHIKSGLCIHDLGPLKFPEYVDHGMDAWFRTQYLECLRQADFTIAVSRHSAIDFSEWQTFFQSRPNGNFYVSLPSSRSSKIKSQMDPTIVSKYPFIKESLYICSIATLEPRKNLIYLIRSFRRFRALFPDKASSVELILVGHVGWKNSELLDIINDDPQGIRQTGFIPKEDVKALFENALCLVMPSHYEGFGLPIAEARSAGIPVITCLNSSLPEASELEEFYVRPWITDDLACQIGRIMRRQKEPDPTKISADTFGWTKVLEGWIEIFQRLLKEAETSDPQNAPQSFYQKSTARSLIDVNPKSALANLLNFPAEATEFFYSHPWTPLPWLSRETDDHPRNLLTQTLISHLHAATQEAVQHAANGSEGALQWLLSDVDWLVLATPCRIESIKGLEHFVLRGGRVLFLLKASAEASRHFNICKYGIARWASLTICENQEHHDDLMCSLHIPETRLRHDQQLFFDIEHRDWARVGLRISAYFQEHYL
jgi:glycosyltransferase involved in cell wall biosynthesis